MKSAIVLVAVFTVALAQINDIEQCQCKKDFVARKDRDGQVKCFGTITRNIAPCNLIEKPRCVCTRATGILYDNTGTWCTSYRQGVELRRWECENKADWTKFRNEYPDEKN